MEGVDPGLVTIDRSRQWDGKDLSPAGHDDDVDNDDYDYEDDYDDMNDGQNIISRQKRGSLFATGQNHSKNDLHSTSRIKHLIS